VNPDPLAVAMFLLVAFVAAGFAQLAWMKSRHAAPFMAPLDGGRTFRGKRLFGANKCWRGFVVMVPAAGAAFVALRLLFAALPPWFAVGLWPLSPASYGALGLWAGFAFMAAELPNSFVKRQLGITPGTASEHPVLGPLFFCIDRLDSVLGVLLALSLVVPVPLMAWVCVLLAGPVLHGLFSVLLYRAGVKARAG
jgi:CDP-2,3-bis-(O-geranylgeranyl)-sn-glycerol synthase